MKTLLSKSGILVALFILSGCGGTPAVSQDAREAAQAQMAQGKALFEEKCRTVAGEKIYRKVEDVEGIVLLKVRPARGDSELADRMWPGAAFASEFRADEYIKSFMWFEHLKEGAKQKQRGILNTSVSDQPGYRFVNVIDEKDGKRYRYTGSTKEVTRISSILIGGDGKPFRSKTFVLEKSTAPNPAPRYGVTFEDHVIPEERYFGVASSTVKVLDLQTGEVLGELTRYAWSPSGPSRSNPVPWLAALECPRTQWRFAETRQFVDQILIPAKEK